MALLEKSMFVSLKDEILIAENLSKKMMAEISEDSRRAYSKWLRSIDNCLKEYRPLLRERESQIRRRGRSSEGKI
ncbi:hypothetical protein YC2023_058038 [Brassica napus]